MTRFSIIWCLSDPKKFKKLTHTLKLELIHRKTYNNLQEPEMTILEYIEWLYTRQSHHSHLGYLSTDEFEKKNVA
jgi:hypothetical protein